MPLKVRPVVPSLGFDNYIYVCRTSVSSSHMVYHGFNTFNVNLFYSTTNIMIMCKIKHLCAPDSNKLVQVEMEN